MASCEASVLSSSLQQSFLMLFQSSHLGVVTATEEKVLDANDAFLAMIGYSREETLADKVDWMAMTPPEYRSLDLRALEQLREFGIAMPFEKSYLLRDGRRVDLVIGAMRIAKSPLTWIAYTIDLTEPQRLRDLQHDLQTKRQVVNELAHELNNPLAALMLLLYAAFTDEQSSAGSRALIANAIEQVMRISDTVRQVLAISAPAEPL
jgi:PAS domain S-box-containing protein